MNSAVIKQKLKEFEEKISEYCKSNDKKCRKKVVEKLFEEKMRPFSRYTQELRRWYFRKSFYTKPSERLRYRKRRMERRERRRRIRQMKKDGTFIKWVSQIRKGFKW